MGIVAIGLGDGDRKKIWKKMNKHFQIQLNYIPTDPRNLKYHNKDKHKENFTKSP